VRRRRKGVPSSENGFLPEGGNFFDMEGIRSPYCHTKKKGKKNNVLATRGGGGCARKIRRNHLLQPVGILRRQVLQKKGGTLEGGDGPRTSKLREGGRKKENRKPGAGFSTS